MAKNKKKAADGTSCRLNKVGGQAVLEGVMMKAGNRTVTTCRKEDGSLVVYDSKFVSIRKKKKFLNIPILRGIVNFIEMMSLSVKTMSKAADALGIEEEDGKLERWLNKHIGVGITSVIMVIATVLGIALAVGLFMFLPSHISGLINTYFIGDKFEPWLSAMLVSLAEGLIKIIIFLLYLWGVGFIPDIKRTFKYHGAEHKSIACFEAGAELTPENAKNYKRFHPRCGTSFMFFMIMLGIMVGFFVKLILPGLPDLAYTGIRLALLPLVVGIGFEFIMLAGKHDNFITKAMSAPGLWVQRITTKEPTEDMLEVAIVSIKCALRDDFPEFMEFYKARPWEQKPDEAQSDAEKTEGATENSDSVTENAEPSEATSAPEAECAANDNEAV